MKPILLIVFLSTVIGCKSSTEDKNKLVEPYLSENVGLNPKAPKETSQFGQFVGEWDCNVMNLAKDSLWQESQAKWKFEYILDGYAIQDYWQNPSTMEADSTNFLLGSNIRIFNPTLKKWQCVWLENRRNTMSGIWEATMTDKGEIIMKDSTDNWEIKFYNISADTFDWKWDFKQPSGKMKTMSKMVAKRHKF